MRCLAYVGRCPLRFVKIGGTVGVWIVHSPAIERPAIFLLEGDSALFFRANRATRQKREGKPAGQLRRTLP